ncbi:unnamed protein product [Echinostoma caproni]|uniref:Uncharacterized protein n=1 Tax=Echinostoma caproni TaxID=27848 RepID=A0A183B8P4_9TREM|nr:unnamed protein product [Echinostoma caproni]
MYATSKLIIPPKPARNSPYIPKLRIKLKPSLNRNRLVHGASLRSSALVQLSRGDVVLRSAHSTRTPGGALRSSHKVTDKINATGGSCEDECRDDTGKATCGDCEAGVSVTKRAGSKRKQATLEMDNLDLEGSESVLTKVNLKVSVRSAFAFW